MRQLSPEVAASVHRGGGGVESIVGQHKQLIVPGLEHARRDVLPERHVPTGEVLADLLAVDPDAAVEGAGLKLKPDRLKGGRISVSETQMRQ